MSTKILFAIIAVGSGFFTALSDIISKDYIRKFDVDSFFVLYVRWVFCALSLFPLVVVDAPDNVDASLVFVSLILVPIEIAAGYFYMKSLELAESTLVLPFQSFTPVFIPPIASLMIDETYSKQGLLGIVLVVLGSFLFFKNNNHRNKAEKKAILYMIYTAVMYAFSSVLGRYVILKISPLFFSASYMFVLSLVLTPYFIRKYRAQGFFKIKRTLIPAFVLGFITALAVITHSVSLLEIESGYMISLKRTSVIFSVLLGYIILREKTKIKERFSGAFLMMIGVFIIGLSIS